MEIYVKMTEEELEEYKKFKEKKEIESVFNDENCIKYIIKRYREITGLELHRYYNYLENRHPISDATVKFALESGNKKVYIDTISFKTNEYVKR